MTLKPGGFDDGDDIPQTASGSSNNFHEQDYNNHVDRIGLDINELLNNASKSELSDDNFSNNDYSFSPMFMPWHFDHRFDSENWVSTDENLLDEPLVNEAVAPSDANSSTMYEGRNLTSILANMSSDVSFNVVDSYVLHTTGTPAKLWMYCSPPLVLGGTLGNILIFCVFSHKRFMKKTVTMYLIVLTIADTILLDIDLSYRWIKVVFEFDIRLISDASCKLYTFGVYLLHQLTSWMIVLATVDRCLTLFYPWWARDVFTHVCSAVLIAMTSLLIVIFNVHFLLTQELFPVYHKQTGESVMTCNTYLQRHRWFVHCIWPWIDLSGFALVPLTVCIICNRCIIGQLLYAVQKPSYIQETSAVEPQAGSSTEEDRNHARALKSVPQGSSTMRPHQ